MAQRLAQLHLAVSCLLGGTGAVAAEIPKWEAMETPFGEMQVREFGEPSGPLAVLVHGMGDSDYIREEFNPVATRLADEGFHVLLPNFHSAPRELRPGRLTGEVFRELLSGPLSHRNEMIPSRYRAAAKPRMLVMGKSWGARMAAEAGALDEVVATALVVPSLGPKAGGAMLPHIHGALGVFLVKDDDVVDYDGASSAIKLVLGSREVTWKVALKGGHRVLPEFLEPLVAFAKAALPAFAHSGDAPPEL